jgi:hypothetical protein
MNFNYGICNPDPECLGERDPDGSCSRYQNDALSLTCFDPGLEYALGDRHCTYNLFSTSGSFLQAAEAFTQYIGPMESFYRCLGSKGCQIFQDTPGITGLQRTVYSRCSRDNCLSILNSAFKAYDPVMGKYNSTCRKFATPGSGVTGASSGVVFAPRALVVAAGIVIAWLL